MNNVTKFDISTKPASGMDAVRSSVTMNWDNMSPDEIRALAQQALVVKLQANLRRQFEKNGIPANIEVNASDYKVGVRTPKQKADAVELAKQLSPEKRAELIKQLQEMENAN